MNLIFYVYLLCSDLTIVLTKCPVVWPCPDVLTYLNSISNRVFCFISEMSNPIVRFDGIEANFIDEKQLQLTVKLVPQGLDSISYNALFLILEKEDVRPEDILGLYKVSANDYSFSLLLSNEGTVNSLRDKKVIGNNKVKLNVISMAEQIVTLRVHWLPLYYDNRLLCEYGEVL